MTDPQDYWTEDDFEDTVAAALIACFETKVKKNRGAAPPDRLTEDRVAVLRAEGPYIASNSRLIEAPDSDDDPWFFDLVNDRLPVKGLRAFRPSGVISQTNPDAYLCAHFIRQTSSMGRYWRKRKSGTLYEMLTMSAQHDGIHGERRYFTVTPRGEVLACTQEIPSIRHASPYGQAVSTIGHEQEFLRETGVWGAVNLQLLADRRHCWVISAQEQVARAHLGCMMEEIKSLLYARSLPMTSTGRKRPILHLVEAHKRRMRNGTDIDVTSFLRGQQSVEIGGTVFTVRPPQTLRLQVSPTSRARYFQHAEAA